MHVDEKSEKQKEQELWKQKIKEQEEIAGGREKTDTLGREILGKKSITWQRGREMGHNFLWARQTFWVAI